MKWMELRRKQKG